MHPEAVVLKFLDAVDADLASDGLHGIEDYVGRFPAHADLIRAEYERLQTAEPEAGNAPSPLSHRAIGQRYRIIESLGRGGFGEVFLAEDTRLNRRVAIKVLTGIRALSAEWRTRLVREAEATNRISDEGLCPVFDVGFEDNGFDGNGFDGNGFEDAVPFLVMPWIPGLSLDRALANSAARGEGPVQIGTVPIGTGEGLQVRRDALLELVERIARTLHFAHGAGIVHRDVKPANILIRPDGRPVLIDFGLASLQATDDTISRSGALGTPAYSAPETLRDGRVTPAPTLDIWSLGVVLFEGLTLRRPFAARPGTSLEHSVLEDPTPRLAAVLGRDLQAVIETALARWPKDRYQTMLAFAEDVRCVRQGLPVTVRAAGPLRRCIASARSRPLAIGFGVAVLGLLLTVSVVGVSLWVRDRERSVVVHAVDILAANMDQAVRQAAKEARSGRSIQDRAAEAERLLAAIRELRAGIGSSPELDRSLSRVLVAAGGLHLQLGDPVRGVRQVEEALQLRIRLQESGQATDEDRGAMAHAMVLLGDARSHVGDFDGALVRFREALEIDAALLAEQPKDATRVSNVAFGHLRIGYMWNRIGSLVTAMAKEQEAVRLLREAEALEPDNAARPGHTADALHVLANTMEELERPRAERIACLAELDVRLATQAEHFPLDATVWQKMTSATLLRAQMSTDPVERVAMVKTALLYAGRVGQLEPKAPYMLSVLSNTQCRYSTALLEAGRNEEAVAAADEALATVLRQLEINPHGRVFVEEKISALLCGTQARRAAGRAAEASAMAQQLVDYAEGDFARDRTERSLLVFCQVLVSPGLGELVDAQRVLDLLAAERREAGALSPALQSLEESARKLQ